MSELSAERRAELEKAFVLWLLATPRGRLPMFNLLDMENKPDSEWMAWAEPHIAAGYLEYSDPPAFRRGGNFPLYAYRVTAEGRAFWLPAMVRAKLLRERNE